MALFPAFSEPTSEVQNGARKGLDWLCNQSFSTQDALLLHQRAVEAADPAPVPSPATRSSCPSPASEDITSEQDTNKSTKKKKKEKKKKKKHLRKKKSREESSGDSETQACADQTEPGRNVSKQIVPISDAVPGRSVWLEDIPTSAAELFRIDKKPDPANWEYKSLYRGDIARYKRKGNSSMGINPKKQCIVWENSISVKKPPNKRSDRYFTKSGVSLLTSAAIPVPCNTQSLKSDQSAFIPVPDWKEGEAKALHSTESWVNPLGIYDPSTTLWLQGKGVPETESKLPLPRECSEDHRLIGKVEEFNRKLRENPGDAQLWMQFVSFQDELMRVSSMYTIDEGELETRKISLKVILEKKLSILERAIESNQKNVDLKLARLKLCEEFWEPAALLKEWHKLVFLHPNDPQLWQKYLLFSQSQFSTFSVSKVSSIYGKCLSTLSAVLDGSMVSHPVLPGTEEAMFAIYLQHCHFLRQAGHSEKAISLYQALMDFTFFKPDTVKDMSTKDQVEFFETFWDSGEPRFGEKGAKGWKSWMHQKEKGGWVVVQSHAEDHNEEEEEDDSEIKDRTLPRWQIWLDTECAREGRHWIPWRPNAAKGQKDEDCEDPERQVVFDELGSSLIKISRTELKLELVHSFLQFLGVPCGFQVPSSLFYLAMDDSSIFDHVQTSDVPLSNLDFSFYGVNSIGHMDTLARSRKQPGHSKEGEEFIANVFQPIRSFFTGEDKSQLSLYWLQYETSKVAWSLKSKNKKQLKLQGKKSKKLAKSLLKEPENRNNLALWQEYAHSEWLLGNVEDARKVFDTAISMAGTKGLKNTRLCNLCLLYAELEVGLLQSLEEGCRQRPVHVLAKLVESGPYAPYNVPISSVSTLKARKAYEHAFEDYISKDSVSRQTEYTGQLVSLVGCYALFQYLTVGVEAAVTVFNQVSEKLYDSVVLGDQPTTENVGASSFASALEALTFMHTNLLQFHMKVSVYPLNPLREALTGALKVFPSSQSLWRCYIQVESKSHNASKARRFFDSIARSTHSLEPWLFAVRAEQSRKELVESVQRVDRAEVYSTFPETGLSNRIKALFEHALQNENGQHCPLLWRLYLHFTVSLGNKERAKGLYYKALQNCPWAKVLYLDAVEYFPGQLQEILDLMTEKELRVRVPMEELDLLLED
ncbi:nuclear exosome regulator NRDE2 [Ambystoma mexicanum]|uniref:nuclear exosome regulator NRDE2 n=1 Tax=Ambystoma mexicanum TaxID=8296 RepID=UPI0037E8E933